MEINTQWFKNRLAERRLSQRGLARQLGMDPAAISLLFNGKRTMKISEAVEIARLLGVPADEIIANAGVRSDSAHAKIAVTGYMDGTGEFHNSSELGTVDHPSGGLPLNINACLCRTAGTPLDHMDGWLLYFEDVRDGVPATAVGRLSLCRMENGVIYIAKVGRGYQRNRWNLSGPAANAQNVALDWAAPVLSIGT